MARKLPAAKQGRKAGFKHSAATKKKIAAALRAHHAGKRKTSRAKSNKRLTNWKLYAKMSKTKNKRIKGEIKKQLTKRRFYKVD